MNLLEAFLIKHCSPTLAALKTANLFNCAYSAEEELMEDMDYWNGMMMRKGIGLFLLRKEKGRALIYVCRLPDLEREFAKPQTAEFMKKFGYEDMDAFSAIRRLRGRLQVAGEFPHEIGVFLGYPLEDVTGFIDNGGKGFLRSGTWKVYSNIDEAEKTFYKYKKCTDIYTNLWEGGKSIWQLTVAA
ncbi:MAG: DUF3793 family protein [Anaerovoracaceae bacterium]